MRQDLTDLTIVLDRSGSMEACRDEAEQGLNHLILGQRDQKGDCRLTLVQFDTEYELIHRAVPIDDVPHCGLVPRGMTALLDAVGRAINETSERLAKLDEPDRPGVVGFVILTDGHENASHEFTRARVREMIERRQKRHDWEFTFLGAHPDAFDEAGSIGIDAKDAAVYAPHAPQHAFAAASAKVTRSRQASFHELDIQRAFTAAERDTMRRGDSSS